MIKSGQMVLKVVNSVHNDKTGSVVLKQINWGTQCKNQVIWYGKGQLGYPMIKSGQMVLKGVNWVHNDKLDQMIFKGVIGYPMQKSGYMVLK